MPSAKPVVILKLDDLRDYTHYEFKQVADYVISKNIKASFGINGAYLEGKDAQDSFIQDIKSWHNSGNIEIWHHGWDHSRAEDRSWFEYKNREQDDRFEYQELSGNYEKQFADFKKTQDIVQEQLGITMHSFGSPYNQNDETFVEVVNQFPQIKVLFFPRTPVTKQLALSITREKGRLNIENGGTGEVDVNYFIDNFNSYDHQMPYMVLQAHPGAFDYRALAAFKDICDFLIERGYQFSTPYQYYLSQQDK